MYLDTRAGEQDQCLKPSAHGANRVPFAVGGLYIQCNARCVTSLVFLPQLLLGSWPRAYLSMMCTTPVLHPTRSKHSAASRPRRRLHASSCSWSGTGTVHPPPEHWAEGTGQHEQVQRCSEPQGEESALAALDFRPGGCWDKGSSQAHCGSVHRHLFPLGKVWVTCIHN